MSMVPRYSTNTLQKGGKICWAELASVKLFVSIEHNSTIVQTRIRRQLSAGNNLSPDQGSHRGMHSRNIRTYPSAIPNEATPLASCHGELRALLKHSETARGFKTHIFGEGCNANRTPLLVPNDVVVQMGCIFESW